MNIFKGQTENAPKVYGLRKMIPEKLKCYLDFRPKATGITLVSFFDFAPMRGLNINDKNIKSVLGAFTRKQDFLLSPDKDDEDKIKILQDLKFKTRGTTGSDYLEEDVQAFLIREILNSGDRDMPRHIVKSCNLLGLRYLTSEFEWSSKKIDRVDILCCDKDDFHKIVVIELKKVRTTKLLQRRYLNILQKNSGDLIRFISALTNTTLDVATPIEIHMVYLMPSHPRLDTNLWRQIVAEHGVDDIVFYKTGYLFDRTATDRK